MVFMVRGILAGKRDERSNVAQTLTEASLWGRSSIISNYLV